jgi:hypothetical protein
MMAKKAMPTKSERTDPKKNKSLAIRLVLKRKPTAKASEVAAVVKKEFGHTINPNQIYMIKTKANMASDGRPRKSSSARNDTPMTSAALWVDAIKTARQLLKATGSMPNAVAILKAVDS